MVSETVTQANRVGGIPQKDSRPRKRNYITQRKRGGAGDYRGRSPDPGGVGRAAFPLGRRFPLCLAFLSAPHFLDAAILSSSAGRGNKGAAAMSAAGIFYPRLSHMADSRDTSCPRRINGFGGGPLGTHRIPEAPKTPPERLHLRAATLPRSTALSFPKNTILEILPTAAKSSRPRCPPPTQKTFLKIVITGNSQFWTNIKMAQTFFNGEGPRIG